MYHKIRRTILNTITNTPLEPIARRAYGVLVPSKGNKYDKLTYKLMESILQDDSSSVDVGAYRGEILDQMQKISPNGNHFAFEPVPDNYIYLKKKFPKAKIFNIALSDKAGETTFNHVVGRPARSGLIELDYPDKKQKVRKLPMRIERLDEVIPKGTRIDFIKIDVEGAELGVLKGAKKIVKKYRPYILFEHNPKLSKHYNTAPEDIYKLLVVDYGMKIYTMSGFFSNNKALTKSSFVSITEAHQEFNFVAKP